MSIKSRLSAFKTTNAYFNASIVYIIANGIGQGTTLLSNIFFTRYMTKSDYGLYSNYYSYVALFVPFVGLNLYYGLINAYSDYKKEIHKLRSSALLLSMFGIVISALLLVCINHTLGLSMPSIAIFLILAHSYGFFLVNYHINSMNMENCYIAKGLMLAVPNILQAVFAAIAVVICNTYISRAIGSTLGILLCGIVAAVLILRSEVPIVNFGYWKYVLKISLPAIIGSVSIMIMQQCDKVMITSMIGAEANAVYSLVFYIGYILYAVLQATSGAWQAWLFRVLDAGKKESITKVQKWYLFFMTILATGLYMIAPEIIRILSPSDYWHFEYVPPFVVGSYLILMYTINMGIIQYDKRTDVNSAIVTIAAIMNVMLNYLLIPRFGGVGAAYTSVLSYLLIFVLTSAYLFVKREFHFSMIQYLTNACLVTALGACFYYVKEMIWIRYVFFVAVLLFEGIYMIRRREDIQSLFGGNIIKSRSGD